MTNNNIPKWTISTHSTFFSTNWTSREKVVKGEEPKVSLQKMKAKGGEWKLSEKSKGKQK